MRHKYETRGIVLMRTPLGEANSTVTLITADLGLIRARAQGIRRSGAKLSAPTATLAESDFMLVRGKETWRIAGAVLVENWSRRVQTVHARERAGRVSGLLLRLVAGEVHDPILFTIMREFLNSLSACADDMQESAEVLAALSIVNALGLDSGEIPGKPGTFSTGTLASISEKRTTYVSRINVGIEASGL